MDKIILSELAKGLNIPKHEITPQSVFYRIGGDSIAALRISAACKKQGVFASVESILRSQTISEILEAAKWLPSPGNIHIQRNNADLSHNACGRDPLTLCVGPSAAAVGQYQINGTSNIRTPIGIDLCHATDGAGISIGAQGRDTAADAHFIPPQNLTGRGSASRACEMMTLQASLVLDTRVRPGNNVISYFQEYPPSRVPALKQAWKKVIQSEPIFRSTFDNDLFWEDGIVFLSWSESTHKDERSFMKELDGIVAPRMREPTTEFQVVTLADSKSILVWHVHHALVDGYSSLLILQKVNTVLHGGEIADGVSFSELARGWRLYQSIFHQQASQFWQEYLAEMKTANSDLRLPSASHQRWPDLPLPKATTFSAPLQRILECSQAKGIPLSAIYYAAWAMTLAIYTGSDTVLFGVLFANRSLPLPGIRDVVGPMMNTLPLLLRLDRSKTTEHLVHHTMERLTQLQQFEWSFPDRYCKMTSVLAMQYDYECDGDLAPNPGASYTRLQSSIPISIFLGPKETVQINYDGNLFHAADMATLGDMYMHAIAALLEADARPLHQYFRQPLPPTMWKDIMLHGNCTSAHSRGGDADTLVSLFDASVKGYPDSVAVVKGDRGLTYAQLNEAATKVASKLCETVEPGDVICVHADRSIYWIIAICAVLKAGAVYCPLDPALPAALRDSYFKTSGSCMFLSTWNRCMDKTPQTASLCHSIEDLLALETNTSEAALLFERPKTPHKANAYLCFTSGSSGFPKGVVCTHEGIVAFQKDYNARLQMRPGLRIAQIMSPAFDGSIHEIFSSLSYGGTIVLSETSDVLSTLQKVDVAMITPSIAKVLNPHEYQNLERIYMVGEHLPQSVCDAWSAVTPTHNLYGPTESSCGSTCKQLVCGEKVTIGRPVQATRIYILDDHQCPLPPGVIGELYTAGVQVSPGYINLPEETAKGFLPDTICQETNQTMYRTRDLGYWNQSGEICLLGRSDRQIKLRGFRLDLDDLEIRMARCSSATSVALALKEDILVAMLQPETTDIAAFVEAIKEALPAQALPRYVRAVTRFPLGNAGKLDYKAIAAAFSVDEPAAPSDHSSSSPSLVTERDARDIITSIWRAVLNLDDSHVLQDDSSFLELGGHSLGQMKLSTRLSAALKTRITLADVVQTGTLGDQVRRFRPPPAHVSGPQPVRGSETGGGATDMVGEVEAVSRSLLPVNSDDTLDVDSSFMALKGNSMLQQTISSTDVIKHPRPCDQASLLSAPSEAHQPIVPAAGVGSELGSNTLSPIEREWLQKYNIRKGSSSFNVNFVCALSNDLDTGRLAAAFTKVLERHSILRSIFPNEQARVYAESPPKVVLTNNIDIRQEINREFNLAEELPIRVFITPTTLVLVASHIVLDLAALNIILSEVEDCWNEKTLQTVSREYGRTVRWSRALSQEDVKFWDNLSGLHHHLEPRRLDYGGRSRVCKIPADIVRAMVQFSTRRGITLHQIALAAAALALSSHGKAASTSAVLGSPHLNRDAEDMDTVGLFLEPLVICIKEPSIEAADGTDQSSVSEDNWALAFCRGVAAASQDALSHAIPWHKLVERHAVQHKHPDVPFIQAMVTFHDNRGHEPLQINGVQPLYTWCEGSKFGLMFEFLAIREDTTILRIEHDSSIYSEANVDRRLIISYPSGVGKATLPSPLFERHRLFDSCRLSNSHTARNTRLG
ncbi:hypothetical protein MY11210_004594 [Beauveria gryllotalpidicola]